MRCFIGNHELVRLTVHDVTLTATLLVIFPLFVSAELLLQEAFHALELKLFVIVATSPCKPAEEGVEVLAVVLVAEIQLSLVESKFTIFMVGTMRPHQFDEAFALILMQDLAGRVPVAVTLFLDVFAEEALRCMGVVATATPVVFLGHSRHESFRLVEGLLHCVVANQALQEFLVEFERARLCNLVSCVDRYHSWCGVDTSYEHLSKASGVTGTQNDDVDVKPLSLKNVLKTFFIKLVDQGWELLIFEAEPAALIT